MADDNPSILSVPVKHCAQCGAAFEKPANDSGYFRKRRFCSLRCAALGSATPALPLADRVAAHAGQPDTATGCCVWNGSLTNAGYGIFSYKNKLVLAHRAAFEVRNGPIPQGLFVCHRCDNPPCVNPDHLFLGDQATNMHDMIAKGRSKLTPKFGSAHGCAKLTEADAKAIKSMPGKQREIAKIFGVTQATVNNIKRGRNWRHV